MEARMAETDLPGRRRREAEPIRRAVRLTDVAAGATGPTGTRLTLSGRTPDGALCAVVMQVAGLPDEHEPMVGEVYELRLTPVADTGGGEGQ